MHAAERDKMILSLLGGQGFVAFRDLVGRMQVSPATLRRDLDRLARSGTISRVRGGAKLNDAAGDGDGRLMHLQGVPFHENITKNSELKRIIGRRAADLCVKGEGVMIDGGSTTLQMCPYLEGKNLQVLTNSLHIVSALLNQSGTTILVPGGTLFREQNIILAPAGEDTMPLFFGPKLFMGAASIGAAGLMQADALLVASERRLIDRAEQVIVLVDSSKFSEPSGNVVCPLSQISTVVTDEGISDRDAAMIERAGVELVVARADS